MILAGDIGGTKTILGLFQVVDGRLHPVKKETFRSAAHDDLLSMVRVFIRGENGIDYACFGVAGPVVEGRCQTTNLPWFVDAVELAAAMNGTPALVVNDLVATAHGIDLVEPKDLLVLQPGVPKTGNRALIAAGTGLGEAMLFWDGNKHVPCPSEGGHTDFAPRDEWEIDLLRYLWDRHGHVSYERILCGPGISLLYDFLVDSGGKPSPEVALALENVPDRSPLIAAAGIENACPLCQEVVARFVSMYGAEAGNLALKVLAVNGVFVAGGIAPKLKSQIAGGRFVEAFRDKGRFRSLLERVPVYLVLNSETALLGAARFAADQVGRASATGEGVGLSTGKH